ncbi:MAG: glutamate synthase [Eubacteriales bacterium]
MTIDAMNLDFQALNEEIRRHKGEITIENCYGQRYIGSGLSEQNITINGTPGNALGAYMDGAKITVNGNGQDAVGDTMNDGMIIIHGNAGDALGYAMRGGKIYVRGNSGYRTGIHMKEYKDKKPVLIIGGCADNFVGEYLAGGVIIILGLDGQEKLIRDFAGTGMHGGLIFVRSAYLPPNLPKQVMAAPAESSDLEGISGYLKEYCGIFGLDYEAVVSAPFQVLKPNAKNPYKRLYTNN